MVRSSSPSASEEDARRSSVSRRRSRASSSASISSGNKKPRRRTATRDSISKRDSGKVQIVVLEYARYSSQGSILRYMVVISYILVLERDNSLLES